MFSNRMRYLLILIGGALGIFCMFHGKYLQGALSLLYSASMIYGFFAYSTIWLAFKCLKSNNNDKAKKLINSTKYPNLLTKKQKGYYYFILGIIKFNDTNYEGSIEETKKAIEIGLRTDNDISIAHANIGHSFYQMKNYEESLIYLNKSIELPHKEELEIMINKLKKKIEEEQYELN